MAHSPCRCLHFASISCLDRGSSSPSRTRSHSRNIGRKSRSVRRQKLKDTSQEQRKSLRRRRRRGKSLNKRSRRRSDHLSRSSSPTSLFCPVLFTKFAVRLHRHASDQLQSILTHFHSLELAAKKVTGKGAKKDRSPDAGTAKKGSPKAGGKKGKKGRPHSVGRHRRSGFIFVLFERIFQRRNQRQSKSPYPPNLKDHRLRSLAPTNGSTWKSQSMQ